MRVAPVSFVSPDHRPSAQKTLKSAIRCTGVGLHGGRAVTMVLRPAEVNTGIVFLRTDQAPGAREVAARWDRVADTKLCTAVANENGVGVATIEHLMAALSGTGIDNVLIEIDGPEVPIMDGSAAPFVFLIECAGIASQAAWRRAIRILRPVEVSDGDRRARLSPSAVPGFTFDIDFASRAIARQHGTFRLVDGAFKAELARARTFGFFDEVEQLRRAGLALGGTLDNAIVIKGDRVLNAEGLRYEDEFVRHKMLDAIGDLYLAGAPILGRFEGRKSGHALNNRLLHTLFADDSAWYYDTIDGGADGASRDADSAEAARQAA
jgi:UDP-3-O-[3-hydroxymyristoyl] N-acetylglucosamine deacetylase